MTLTPPPGEARENLDDDPRVDAAEDDWEWRRRLRANPATAKIYRVAVFIVGLAIVVLGLLLIPFPGPGWLIVIAGLAIWATEFERAQRILDFVKRYLRIWEEWVKRQNLFVKGIVGIVGIAFIATLLWLTFHFSGIPGFFPDGLENWMRTTARI
ncbi:TIGR02611 family protein [Knoellia sp. S7-12]|uniref:TIGR02611 family protein n=1 Tax=Knoellia sp. S7-12 TaxID=3126698 RepID=UPI003367313B